jgi:hypothetical protein
MKMMKKLKKIEWIKNGDLSKNLAELKKGEVVKFDAPIEGGKLLWYGGESGSPKKRAKLIHWEMFSEKNIIKQDNPVEISLPSTMTGSTGWAALPAANQNLLVKKAATNREKAYFGETVTFKVTECNYKDAPASELNKINWKIVATDNSFSEIKEDAGASVNFTIPESLKEKTIKAHPYKNSPSNSIFAQVSVFPTAKKEWLVVEDSDSNYNVDCKKIIGLFPGEMTADENITTEELVKFYKENPDGNAEKLRNAICKFVSEWGITDLDAAIDALKNRGFWMPNPKEKLSQYIWWKDAVDKGVDLPGSANVWHYHPVRLLEEIAGV